MTTNPLVSVIVTTFNAAAYVLETLESVKSQTYRNIELIVSDDASTDNTVSLCKEWLAAYSNFFVRTDVITVPKNTGVSANCNRCIAASNAEWIKFIAGDDILLPSCIEDNMRFVAENPNVRVVFSQVLTYRNTFVQSNFVRTIPQSYPMNIMNPSYSADDQFKLLLLSDRINFTPSYFFKKEVVISVGGYDEKNRIVEDYPMWLKLTRAGIKLHFIEKPTVGYRQHENAINNKISSQLIKPSVLRVYPFRKGFVHPLLPWDLVGAEKFMMNFAFLFDKLGWNSDTRILRMLYRFCTVHLNPFRYLIFFKKRVLNTQSIFYQD